MSHYKLTYFNVRGRAEILKLIFAAAGVEFEDNKVEGQQWPALKKTTPFGSMPLLEVDGVVLAQCNAIGRFLARRFGLDGQTDLDKARADMVMDYYNDITSSAQSFLNEKDETKKAEAKKKFHDEQLPVFLGNLEKLVNHDTGYLAGKSLTWADLGLFILAEKLRTHQIDGALAKFEKLSALHKRVAEHPRIAAWNASRPQTPIIWT